MLNLWIGLCKGVPGLPSVFRDLGYEESWIEKTFRNQDGEQVNPELIVCSEKIGHSILFEWKSGKNAPADQLKRYSLVSANELQGVVMMSVKATKRFDVVIVGLEENVERLKMAINGGGYKFPLLIFDDRSITLSLNQFSCPELNEIFTKPLALGGNLPLNFVPIDQETDIWDVADTIMPRIFDLMRGRQKAINVKDLCPVICPLWSIMGKSGREQIHAKIREVLQAAQDGEFSKIFSWRPKQDDTLEIVNNPLGMNQKKTSSPWRKLGAQYSRFRHDLVLGKRSEPSLFDPRTWPSDKGS